MVRERFGADRGPSACPGNRRSVSMNKPHRTVGPPKFAGTPSAQNFPVSRGVAPAGEATRSADDPPPGEHQGRVAAAIEQITAAQRAANRPLAGRYDFVIIGGGSAGCIIAAELAAGGRSVLLLEEGGSDATLAVVDPGRDFTNLGSQRVQTFHSEPSPALGGRRVKVGGGRVLGGGSSVNSMTWIHGHPADFDSWARDGCEGWGATDLMPLFREVEDWEGGANAWRGAGGPIHVRVPPNPTALTLAFIAGNVAMGLEQLGDINGPRRNGVGTTNNNVTRDGLRCTSATAYLLPQLRRPNLILRLNAPVVELTFGGDRCTGCRVQVDGRVQTVLATCETVLCAGAHGSPTLLLRSGIGQAAALRALGLTVRVDLPGVGANLQDHALVTRFVLRAKGSLPVPSPSSNHSEALAFLRSGEDPSDVADLSVLIQDQPFDDPEAQARYGALPGPGQGFLFGPAVIRPTGRGSVRLASLDYREPPRIDNGLLKTDRDLKAAMRGVEYCRELAGQAALRAFTNGEAIPGDRVRTPDDLAAFVRETTNTYYHPVGTCRMGRDRDAVVDPNLRVHGIRGLRVCDSSVMPTITSGPPNATTYVIGLKAARLLALANA